MQIMIVENYGEIDISAQMSDNNRPATGYDTYFAP